MLANYLKIGECTYSKTYKDFKKQDIQLFPHRNECDKGFASDFSLRTEGHKLIKKLLGEGAIVSHMEKVNRILYFVI